MLGSPLGCTPDDTPIPGDGNGDGDGDGDGPPCAPSNEIADDSTCTQLDSDYSPGADDDYDACISDGGTYERIGSPPSSIGRVEAFDRIADILWRSGTPNAADFVEAREVYDEDQGLGSRVERREDLHYPPIPADDPDRNPGVDDDKQCSVTAIANKHPDRCAGPAKIRPLINRALIDGANGDGDANASAARVKAGGLWFLYLSIYKEATTCFTGAAKDCDSSWAYYTGAQQVAKTGLGLAKMVSPISEYTHQRIFDGVLAVRCVRDLYPQDDYPTFGDVPPAGQSLFETAAEQLDQALHRGYALTVRRHLLAHSSCEASASNWAFIQTAGPVLDREAATRDPTAAAELAALWALSAPDPTDINRAIALLDSLFDCG